MMTISAPNDLHEAVSKARAAATPCLWTELQKSLGIDAVTLHATLSDTYGIAVIQECELADAIVVDRMGSVGVIVERNGQRMFATNDPWSREAQEARRSVGRNAPRLSLAPAARLRALIATPVSNKVEEGRGGSNVSEFVDLAIARAVEDGASDIHFESDRNGVTVKYRLDGVMCSTAQSTAFAEEVLSRIKVMAQLDITERRRPQDGRIHWQGRQRTIDLRVSIMPSIFGEDAVLRLLDKAQLRSGETGISLQSLGFDAATSSTLRALAERPHGMMLVTGPTGSGKTTTVYAALSEVNSGIEKIITIEDPVEYELPGVLQIPVNEQKGLTFATGLRSILRHDPDKILVGEIRDAETAEIAVQSALTGHLVFTTVHANSLFDVLGRFQHFGLDPFALTSALNGVVVQRLLRRVCPHCMRWGAPTLETGLSGEVPAAVGCSHCRGTGYKGRFVVAEVHELDDSIRDLVLRRAAMTELKAAANARLSAGLLSLALDRVKRGETTIEEVKRVIGLV